MYNGTVEIAAFVVSLLSLLGAGVMAFYAHGANVRADEANRRAAEANEQAREALDLEKRQDERAREFRAASWRGALLTPPDGPATFELTNSGLSEARDVVLVVSESILGEAARFDLGVIKPGQTIDVAMDYGNGGPVAREFGWSPGYVIHWVSPLGHASRIEVPEQSIQLY